MASEIKSYHEVSPILGNSKEAFEKLVGYIRFNYVMDELWTTGTNTGKLSNYRDELKFRRGGKTLITLYIRDGLFKVCIVLGKDERAKFEEKQSEFSDTICKIYDETHTYHDGKWLGFDIPNTVLIDDIIKLLHIKRRPNRKAHEMEITKDTGKCGNRCDLCLLYIKNNEGERADRYIFGEMDWRCYHHEGEERSDYSNVICPGCAHMCGNEIPRCLEKKGFESCGECDFHHCDCANDVHIADFEPGRCNLGLTADEVTCCVIPYCGKERFDRMKNEEKRYE